MGRRDSFRFDLQHGLVPADEQQASLVHRNRLVSALLRDRGVLRMITGPAGFGKTSLAKEYAIRMSLSARCTWVDASDPGFLLDLDTGEAARRARELSDDAALVIIDDIPWLHEIRSQELSRCIDLLLYGGVEVIAIATPAHDTLGMHQPDRVLVSARDLLVTADECLDAVKEESAEVRAQVSGHWARASKRVFGNTPASIWGDGDRVFEGCLTSVFTEGLPREVMRAIIAAMLLGQGSFDDLAYAATQLSDDVTTMLERDYPIAQADAAARRFSVGSYSYTQLLEVIKATGHAELLASGVMPLVERVATLLFREGRFGRARDLLTTLGSSSQAGCWAMEHGWSLIDCGELSLLDELLARAPAELFDDDCEALALRAWSSGLTGHAVEACYIAQSAYARTCDDGDAAASRGTLASYLALQMFDDNALVVDKPPAWGLREIDSAQDFLACVVELCTEVELARAFAEQDTQRYARLEQMREPSSDERASSFVTLFTQHHERFRSELAYRIALHLLAHIDHVDTKRLFQQLSSDVVIAARRKGVKTLSDALVVRDLWRGGYFGLGGLSDERRDAHVLDDAGAVLHALSTVGGGIEFEVPWDFSSRGHVTQHTVRVSSSEVRDVEHMNVKLFGTFEVSIGNRVLSSMEWRRKTRLLFTVLVLYQGRDIARPTLYDMLWPDMGTTRARNNFYSTWHSLVDLVGEDPYLERDGEFCRVNPSFVHSDIAEFERLTRQLLTDHVAPQALLDTYARIESVYHGGLYPGEDEVQLIVSQRKRCRAMFVDAMITASARALDERDARLALWFARKAMEEERKREDVYAALIRAQVAAGQRCSAIRTYFECQEFLRDELGLDPSFETQQLYDRLIANDPSLLVLEASTFKY